MQQLRRRADVVDVDLTSHPSWEVTYVLAIVVCSGVGCEGLARDAAMFEGRAA